jgi:hypothetical protein
VEEPASRMGKRVPSPLPHPLPIAWVFQGGRGTNPCLMAGKARAPLWRACRAYLLDHAA